MKKINIAEILKDCPQGTKLYSPIFGEVELDEVTNSIFVRHALNKTLLAFYTDGTYCSNGECMLFPSKENRDWSTFQRPFKDGDVVATIDGTWVGITLGGKAGEWIPTYCVIDSGNEFMAYLERKQEWVFNRLATEEEKEKLFKAIKDNGYKWNAETKTLEKKKKEYPTTYEKCCKIVQTNLHWNLCYHTWSNTWDFATTNPYANNLLNKLDYLYKLLICRDAYWKIAGWKPDGKMKSDNYNLIVYEGDVIKDINCSVNHVLSFPTEEMRDAFYENFMDLINECKELL